MVYMSRYRIIPVEHHCGLLCHGEPLLPVHQQGDGPGQSNLGEQGKDSTGRRSRRSRCGVGGAG